MNYDAFVAKWNTTDPKNPKSIDWDGKFGAQCVDEVAQYCVENGKPVAYANAKDWANNPALLGAFDWIANNPSDFNQVPKKGDIIIWSGYLPGSGDAQHPTSTGQGFGHISIFDHVVSAGIFSSLDQNWGGMYVHFVTHNWNYILGWLSPKASAPAPPSGGGQEMIADTKEALLAYKLLRGNVPVTSGELAGTAGKRTWVEFATTAGPEIDNREKAKADTQAQIANLTTINNNLAKQIADITGNLTATKADKDAALAEIAKLQADLTTAMDKLKEAQSVPQVPPQPTTTIPTGKSLWDVIKDFFSQFKKGQS